MSIAWRNLLNDKTRLALSIGGVAFAVMLILILNGFLSGMYAQIGAYLEHEPGTLVIAQDVVENLRGISSRLPANVTGTVAARGASRVTTKKSSLTACSRGDTRSDLAIKSKSWIKILRSSDFQKGRTRG
jgi:hypothetical protein